MMTLGINDNEPSGLTTTEWVSYW